MLFTKLIFVYILGYFSPSLSQEENKLNILVLYESLCPDSEHFMQDQLGTSYDLLKDYIKVRLVPFGKSQSANNGGQFFCQHGPAECEGNRMQSCVLHKTTDQDAQVKFVVCQMTAQDKSSIKYCAESVGLSSDIDECMKTDIGTHLQLEAEQLTNSYAPSFIPTIIYDNVFDQQLQDNSLRNFKGVVCSLLQKSHTLSIYSNECQ